MHRSSINQSYRLVFNASSGTWVAAPETARGRGRAGRSLRRMLLGAALWGAAHIAGAQALPQAVTPVGDRYLVTTSSDGKLMQVKQSSNQSRAVIDWYSFSIGKDQTVQFIQDQPSHMALNRVTGSTASLIEGKLISDGKIFLANPNGVLFTKDASVDTAGLLATTLRVTDTDAAAFKNGGSLALTALDPARPVINDGLIAGRSGAHLVLIGQQVINNGTINGKDGYVQLLAGSGLTLTTPATDPAPLTPATLTVTGVRGAEVHNTGTITNSNRPIILRAVASGTQDLSALIHQSGTVAVTQPAIGSASDVLLDAQRGTIVQTGTVSASGTIGGTITVVPGTRALIDGGQWLATGSTGQGGTIQIDTLAGYEQTTAGRMDVTGATGGGSIRVSTAGPAWLSGALVADGQAGIGGNLYASGRELTLAGAALSANGPGGGGSIQLGQWQGLPDAQRALRTTLTEATVLRASATTAGRGGTVTIGSRQLTAAAATIQATGGRESGDGGTVTVGSEQGLAFGGRTDASAAAGIAGRVNLVGRDLSVEGSVTGLFEVTPLARPGTAATGGPAGPRVMTLTNGRTVVVDPEDSTSGTNAGAVRLYERDGALVAVVAGRLDGDRLGSNGITPLKDPATGATGSSFVIASPDWGGAGLAAAGAATRVDGAAARSLVVTSQNSLVGATAGDRVSSGGVTALTNGHYVVNSPEWNNGTATRAGAATWRNGVQDTSMAGAVGTNNSLYGGVIGSRISSGGTTALANGNYVVASPEASFMIRDIPVPEFGAVTWRDGTGAGGAAAVERTNSFSSILSGARVGSGGVFALTNGNYVVSSPDWSSSASGPVALGAVTLFNGFTGRAVSLDSTASIDLPGAVTSLIGSSANDRVGSGGIVPLANGNFVVVSPSWNGNTGAVTWSSGTGYIGTQPGPTVGAVSAANSLIGSRPGDALGSAGATALANGHYVVASPRWSTDAAAEAGAVTWRDGYSAGVVGELAGENSLIGGQAFSRVGSHGVTALLNGHYVVNSPNWSSATATGAGAVTWRNGNTPTDTAPVTVSASNSLVGTLTGDQVGSGGIVLLRDGNYAVVSPQWSDSSALQFNVGAVTWRDAAGTAAKPGTVTTANSLTGGSAGDQVGAGGVVALEGFGQGGYLVLSPKWTHGIQASAGAATPVLRTASKVGTVSAGNSFVGTRAGDQVGSGGAVALDDGGYAIGSPEWSNGSLQAAGAITVAAMTSTSRGALTEANSLLGQQAEGRLGAGPMAAMSQGRVLVDLPVQGARPGGPAIVRRDGNPGLSPVGTGAAGGASVIQRSAVEAAAMTAQLALKAHNDLILNTPLQLGASTANRPVALSLVAGRSVSINGQVGATGGGLAVTANADAANNGLDANGRGSGKGDLTMAHEAALAASDGSVTVAIDGASDVGSITLARVDATSLTVRSSALTLASATVTAKSREYDGSDKAELEGEVAVDGLRLVNSNLRVVATGAFDDRHVGNQKAVKVSAALTGFNGASTTALRTPDGKDLASTTPVTASITRAPLTLKVDLGTKEYDGTVDAPQAQVTAVMLNDADSLDFGTSPPAVTFDSKSAGAGKAAIVTVTALGGAQVRNAAGDPVNAADNYDITRIQYASVTGKIDKRVIDGTLTAQSRVYDGTSTATFTSTTQGDAAGKPGLLTGDDVRLGASARFADANAGLNKQVTFGQVVLEGADAGNYALRTSTFMDAADASPPAQVRSSNTVYAHIDKRIADVEYWAKDKTYDGSTQAQTAYTLANKVDGDDLSYTIPLVFTSRAASTDAKFTVDPAAAVQTGTLTGASKDNYQLVERASPTHTGAVIDPLLLDLTFTAADKVYDGTRDARVSASARNLIGADVVTLVPTARFLSKDAGTNSRVEITAVLPEGADAGNYRLPTTFADAQASITPRPVDFTASAASKVYDGTRNVTLQLSPVAASTASGAPPAGLVAGDLLTIAGTGAFSSKNVGAAVPVSLTPESVQLAGADARNYTLGARTGPALAAAITPRELKVTAKVNDKVYDGTTQATASLSADAVPGDTLSFNMDVTFSDRNAGTGKTVTIDASASNAVSGPDAGNYRLASALTTNKPTITPAPLVATRTAPVSKVYDGRRDMALTLDTPALVRSQDNVTVDAQLLFPDKNVGAGRPLTWGAISLQGDDARNYYVQGTSLPPSGEITPRPISVMFAAAGKVYDGSRQAAGSFTALNLLGGDLVSARGDALFDDANAGIDKKVTASAVSLAGRDAMNYVVTLPPSGVTSTASIRPRAIDVSATGSSRTYDGSSAASVMLRPADVVAGDILQATGSASFNDRNVGNDKPITVTDIQLSGSAAGNYQLKQTITTARGSITPRTVDVTAQVQDKVYDGTTAANVTYALQRVVAGDEVRVAGQAAYADPDTGTAKASAAGGLRLSGANAANYRIGQVDVRPGTIRPRPVSVAGSLLVDQSGVLTGQRLRAGDVLPGDSVALIGRVAVRPDQIGLHTQVSDADLVTSNGNYVVGHGGVQIWITPPAGTAGALGLPLPPAAADQASPAPGRDRRARAMPDFTLFRVSSPSSDSPAPSTTRPSR